MSDRSQQSLGAFGADEADGSDDSDGRDAAAEAAAVAGETSSTTEVVAASDRSFDDVEERVSFAVTQVDYTIEGRGDDEYPVMHVFGRTAALEAVHARVYDFEPYFYAPAHTVSADRLRSYDRITGWEETDESGEPYESIRGERLVKIFGQTPRDVGQIRDEFDHYEADILFPNRFLIDEGITSGLSVPRREGEGDALRVHHAEVEPTEVQAEPRVNVFDIEVEDRSGFPEDGEEPIVCLTSHDSYDEEYVVWLYEAPQGCDGPEALTGYEPISGDFEADVRAFAEEEAMLEAFLEYVEETDPDVLTGWNFDDFDAPYLLDRLAELQSPGHDHDLDYNRLSRVDEVWRSDWQGPDVKGRVVFDLLYAYQRTQFSELDSYRLDAVGEEELGVGKERYPGDIGGLWEDDPERLLEYNLRDVELCVELNAEQGIIPFWDEVRTFVGCKLEDATTPGDAVDMYVLHKLHGEFALPSKGQQESEDYEGGAVFDPITGVRENVTVLDLKCFSGDTDVMTPEGPKNIRDVEEGDDVYTLNPDTFECEVKPIAETHQYENQFGELHHVSGNTHDLKVTENHRFLVSSERGWDQQDPSDFEFAEYREIPDYERFAFPQHEPMDGRSPDTFDLSDVVDGGHVVAYSDDDLRVFRNAMSADVVESLDLVHGSSEAMGVEKSVGKYLIPLSVYRDHTELIEEHADDVFLNYDSRHRETPLSFRMEDWLEFVGWVVTEGSVDENAGRLTIHQDGESERGAIQELLDRMGVNYNAGPRGINVSNEYILQWVTENCGKGYANKRLPDWVFELDGELSKILLETMIRGDGSWTESGLGKFWTKSDELKSGFVDLAVRCGHKPTVSEQADGTWYVSVGKRGSFTKSSNASVEEHDGDVYCVTAADNHVVMAGRNGNFQWVGQSLYPMCMVTTNASPETKVDPDVYDGDTYVAPNGTHFRKEPDGVIREMVDELLSEREEKKGLRNDHEPDSPEYQRYDRQQSAVKVIMNCFTPDTEVVTPDGVRGIRDLDIGDEVYSLDPETMEMEVKPVVETHAYPEYEGELVDVETSKIDFSVTPNHRMLVRKNDKNGITEDGWGFKEASDLYDYCHYEMPHDWEFDHADSLPDRLDIVQLAEEYTETTVTIADGGSKIAAKYGTPNVERYVPTGELLTFFAWYITEGNVYEAKTANYRVKIAQESDLILREIETLVESFVDYHYSGDDRSVSFSSRVWGDLLQNLCGSGSENKKIPDIVFKASREQKERFLNVLIKGDGDRQENSWRYSTASKQLRDDVLRLCAELGLSTNYNRDSGTWRIYCSENAKNSFRLHRDGDSSKSQEGVYCVSVKDNNTLLAGRNGKFQHVGNSLYGVLGWDRFRLYDREMGAAVTATGREVIDYTDEVAQNEGFEVVYGDTDSVMLEVGNVSPADVDGDVELTDEMRDKHPEMDDAELETIVATIQKGFELEESINDSYDGFALERLNAEFHRFEIEFEKLYRRFFQAGKKKRYAGHIVWKEGKDVDDVDITGFEYQRSDIAPITKRVQKRVIDMIVHGEDVEDVKEYVHDVIEDFQAGNVDPEDVGIPGGIGKRLNDYDTDTAQVRGAKYANMLLGTNFQRGSKPKRLYLDRVHEDFFQRVESEQGLEPSENPLYAEFCRDPDVICFEFADQIPEEFEVDWEKMLDKTLKGPIARILEALDISWDEVKSGQEQTGLGQFS